MKRIVGLILALVMALSCTACGQQKEEPPVMEPKVSQMKAICELAVMECYYHNVAKYFEKDAEKGFLGFGKKDKHFWIEYSGVVKLGVDISLVSIEVDDTQITITLPEAKVLECKIDSSSLNEDSFIVDKDSADVKAEDEVKAFGEAQAQMEKTASDDKALLASAQQRAQSLLEDYIVNIGNVIGKEYSIKWIYLDAEEKPSGEAGITETSPEAPPETEKPADEK